MKPTTRPDRSAVAIPPLLAILLLATASAQTPPADPKPATPAPAPAPAANPDQPLPRTPLVPRLPARAEWTVRMTREFSGAWETGDEWEKAAQAMAAMGGNREIRSVQTSKDSVSKTYRLRTRWSDGDSEDEWIVLDQHVADRPEGGYYIVAGEATTSQDLRRSDFPELEWLEMSHYRGLKTYKGKKVFAFSLPFDEKRLTGHDAQVFMLMKQRDKTITPSKFFKPKSQQIVVYLDMATQLPLLYNDGTTLRRYSYNEPTEARLRPTAAVLNFLRKRHDDLQKKLATPPGP